ncbi:hypothetical protein H3Z85_10505 [Chryseobacterium indologenes]|nr:hypothetical protein H3Z85_10505 [Chryseobacterium indologenes]
MVSKNKFLISVFAALFLLLLGIQVYFMYKTYQVKERDIYRSVIDGLPAYTDTEESTQRAQETKDDALQKVIIQYYNKEISKKDFIKNFTDNRYAVRKRLSHYIDNRLQKDGYKISARIEYTSIIHLPDSTKLIDKPFIVFETKEKVKNPKIGNTSSWETTSSKKRDSDHKEIERRDTFYVKSQIDFEITNIKTIVFKELALLFFCCILLLSCVLLIYISTIKNLIKQQKQVEVLHTVVDNISHEFKTPIATLKIASKTLKKAGIRKCCLLLTARSPVLRVSYFSFIRMKIRNNLFLYSQKTGISLFMICLLLIQRLNLTLTIPLPGSFLLIKT